MGVYDMEKGSVWENVTGQLAIQFSLWDHINMYNVNHDYFYHDVFPGK